MKPLNSWSQNVSRRAQRLVEDADRKWLVDKMVTRLIERLERLATAGAHATPAPRVHRHQGDDGVVFDVEWVDEMALWFLCLSVRRTLGEKPRIVLEFCGENERSTVENPTDTDIQKALHEYFQAWKKPHFQAWRKPE